MYYDKLTSLLEETRMKMDEYNGNTVNSGHVSEEENEDLISITLTKNHKK